MSAVMTIILQAIALVPPNFDLRSLDAAKRCDAGKGGEIVVCGSRDADRYRLKQRVDDRFEPKPLLAEVGLGKGATADVHVESSPLAQGALSNRVMLRLKTKF